LMNLMSFFSVGTIVVIVLVVVSLWLTITFVKTNTCVLVERLGQYTHTLKPGVHFLTPFVDRLKTVAWTWKVEDHDRRPVWRTERFTEVFQGELLYDFAPVEAQTMDRISVSVNGFVFYRISDIYTACYCIDVGRAVSLWIEGAIRNATAQHKYQDLVSQASRLQNAVFKLFEDEKHASEWGITLTHLSIQSIDTATQIKSNLEELTKQKNNVIAQQELLKFQLDHKEREKKAALDLEMMEHKHQLQMQKAEIEAQALHYKMLIDSGMSPDYLLALKQTEILKSKTNKIIVPHNFRSLHGLDSQKSLVS